MNTRTNEMQLNAIRSYIKANFDMYPRMIERHIDNCDTVINANYTLNAIGAFHTFEEITAA